MKRAASIAALVVTTALVACGGSGGGCPRVDPEFGGEIHATSGVIAI